MNLGIRKMLKISWLGEELLASKQDSATREFLRYAEKKCVCLPTINRLMFKEKHAIYCVSQRKYIITLCSAHNKTALNKMFS